MASSSVVVLTPDGRRVKVKTTPNTSILQVLEEACQKHGYNSTEYDLKHYSRIIEPTNSFRFSGLPNNATLEMVQSPRPRQETSINLCLQLENGKRLMHPFNAQNTLWDVIKHWADAGEAVLPATTADDVNAVQPVCVYLRQEIVGQSQLEHRTLRSLGLVSHSACIQLRHRTVTQLGFQANVSTPLTRTPTTIDLELEDNESAVPSVSSMIDGQGQVLGHGSTTSESKAPNSNTDGYNNGGKKRQLSISPTPMDTDTNNGPTIVAVDTPTFPLDLSGSAAAASVVLEPYKPRISQPGALHILGDHQALLYHADDVNQPSTTSIPESFFDVTRGDVEAIWRDLRARRQELEEAPLSTATLREQQREDAILRNLHQHPVTVIRIRFRNRYVLQGVFRAVDTVGAVMNMVKTHLANAQIPFYLFTSPPKTILDPDQRLVEAGLVGLAVAYFGSEEIVDNYLKVEVCDKVSSPDAIDTFLLNMDKNERPRIDPISMTTAQDSVPVPPHTSAQGTSASSANKSGTSKPIGKGTNTDKVPKWFNKNQK